MLSCKFAAYFQNTISCGSAISVKLQSNFIETTPRHGCSRANLLHIFRTPFPKNTSGWLLLSIWEIAPYECLTYKCLIIFYGLCIVLWLRFCLVLCKIRIIYCQPRQWHFGFSCPWSNISYQEHYEISQVNQNFWYVLEQIQFVYSSRKKCVFGNIWSQ